MLGLKKIEIELELKDKESQIEKNEKEKGWDWIAQDRDDNKHGTIIEGIS